MSIVKSYRTVGATNNALAYKEIDRRDQVKKKDPAKAEKEREIEC